MATGKACRMGTLAWRAIIAATEQRVLRGGIFLKRQVGACCYRSVLGSGAAGRIQAATVSFVGWAGICKKCSVLS